MSIPELSGVNEIHLSHGTAFNFISFEETNVIDDGAIIHVLYSIILYNPGEAVGQEAHGNKEILLVCRYHGYGANRLCTT